AIVKLIGKEITPASIDGIAAADLVYDEEAQRRLRRPSGSARPPRNGHADAVRPKRPGQRRTLSPTPGASPQNNNGVHLTRAAARASPPPRPLEHEPSDDGRQTVGFGDHLPAFLARPPRIVARPSDMAADSTV